MGLDLNVVSARYPWDIQRAVLETAGWTSLAVRREWRQDLFLHCLPASAGR